MKLTTLMILIGFLQVSAATYGQHVNLNAKDITINKLFKELNKQTGYTFLYKAGILKDLPNVNVEISDASITEVLDKFLKDKPLDYLIIDKSIVIRRKANFVQPVITMLYLGKVIGANKKPLAGVTIKVKGAPTGQTVTNENGDFSILVLGGENMVLQFSYIGYESVDLPLKGIKNPLLITMKEATSTLDQVQVLAYGEVKKRYNTGDVTTITAKQIENNPVPNVLQALQNQVPGLFIQQKTGKVGGAFNVQIRPGSTFGTGNPLYIVDGVTYPAGTSLPLLSSNIEGYHAGPLLGGNALSYLNPNDIESVTVLKDADATAIYGSRGAYGVIIIKTKKGRPGPSQLNVNFYKGVTVVGTTTPLLNTQDYLMLRNEALKNDGVKPGAQDLDVNGTWPTDRYTNWQKEFTGNYAPTTNANISYMGGDGTTNFRIGGNYLEQSSTQKGSGDDKNGGLNFDINTGTKNRKFTMDISGGYSSDVNTMVPYDFTNSAGVLSAPNAPPLLNPDGSLNWDAGDNPLAGLNAKSNITTNNLLSTMVLSFNPFKGLTITSTTAYNLLSGRELVQEPTSFFDPSSNPGPKTNSSLNQYTTRTWNEDVFADYTNKLGSKGVLDVKAGLTMQDILSRATVVSGTNFVADQLLADPAQGITVVSSYSQAPFRYIGYFGHLNYVWDDKYILNLNGRYDGSTKFGPGKQFGAFGSVGAAWLFSEEKWFKDHIPFISFGKLRGSYGTVGGDNIGNYQYLTTFSTTTQPYQGITGLVPNSLANRDLNWELKKEAEIGINLDFFNGRISLEANYYRTRTSNQLVNQNLSTVTGFAYYIVNSPALIQTNGPEIQLSTKNIKTANFSWNTDFNVSMPRNKLLKYPGIDNAALAATNINYIIGKPITGVKLYNYAGVDPQTGEYNFINKAGVKGTYYPFFAPVQLDQVADRTQFIDLNPKFFGGINNTVRYKNLSLGFFFSITDRMALNYYGQQIFPAGFFNQNTTTLSLQRWQKPGDITKVPKVTQSIYGYLSQNNFVQSTGAYSNTTYARLQNANINYNFSPEFLRRARITNLNVFLRGENLLTISKYKDLDPESLSAGATPPLRVFTAGFNMTL